jgi:hypothetical protein
MNKLYLRFKVFLLRLCFELLGRLAVQARRFAAWERANSMAGMIPPETRYQKALAKYLREVEPEFNDHWEWADTKMLDDFVQWLDGELLVCAQT